MVQTPAAPTKSLYDQDFSLWLEATVNQLKTRDLSQLDYDNLIEELEDMGRSEKLSLDSNLCVVLLHLLKYLYQPKKRSKSWQSSIYKHRRNIQKFFKFSPSLKHFYAEIFDKTYEDARKLAADETGLPLATFPAESPFTPEQVLDCDYLPD